MSEKDGGPAFPGYTTIQFGSGERTVYIGGMSLRDYFAGQALAGMCISVGNEGAIRHDVEVDPENVAHDAYKVADAMLKERAK